MLLVKLDYDFVCGLVLNCTLYAFRYSWEKLFILKLGINLNIYIKYEFLKYPRWLIIKLIKTYYYYIIQIVQYGNIGYYDPFCTHTHTPLRVYPLRHISNDTPPHDTT